MTWTCCRAILHYFLVDWFHQWWEWRAWCPSCGGWEEFPKLDKKDMQVPSRAAGSCHLKLSKLNPFVWHTQHQPNIPPRDLELWTWLVNLLRCFNMFRHVYVQTPNKTEIFHRLPALGMHGGDVVLGLGRYLLESNYRICIFWSVGSAGLPGWFQVQSQEIWRWHNHRFCWTALHWFPHLIS